MILVSAKKRGVGLFAFFFPPPSFFFPPLPPSSPLLARAAANTWQVQTTNGGPSARVGHSASVVGGQLIVVGGVGVNGVVLSDVWSYTIATRTWALRTPSNAASALGPRYLHVAVQGPTANSVCFYGGSATVSNALLLNNGATPNTIHCLDVGTNAWLAPRTALATVRTLAGAQVVGSSAAGFTVVGGISAGALQGTLMSYSFASSTWTSTLASPIAYAAHVVANSFGYLFGGLRNPLTNAQPFNTAVIAIGPVGVWNENRLTCEPGYSGTTCSVAVCTHNCYGLGRCVGPDLCECMNGFTGAQCSQQLCAACNINYLDLNQAILWPRAKMHAAMCMNTLEQQILTIRSLLPKFPQLCGDPYTAGTFPLDLKQVSLTAWQFETQTSSPLADIAAQTAQWTDSLPQTPIIEANSGLFVRRV